MIETESVRELKVTARLVYDGKEIRMLEKTFAVQAENENEKDDSKTLDDTVTEFTETLMKTATEMGYTISKDILMQSMITLILYIVKQDGDERTIEVQLTEPEAKENGDEANSS
jgi:hypothetical protein